MNFLELKKFLHQNFDVKSITWLEDLSCRPSSFLYQQWAPCLQESYKPAQRFVLLNFRPIDDEILEHVSWLINYLDISPCFVILVTNQSKSADWFQGKGIEVNHVNYNIPHFLPINPVSPKFNHANSMCAHAWSGIHVWPSGQTSVCCYYKETIKDEHGNAFNIKEHGIKEILGSSYMNNLRDKFRQGIRPNECSACWQSESTGGESKHSTAPYKLDNIYARINWESNDVDNNLGFIGGHLGNLCNLKCRICSPVYSSSIAVEEINFAKKIESPNTDPSYELLVNNRWNKNSDKFWAMLRENSDKILNFEFLGGEPLLLQENIDFMQWLVDTGRSQKCTFEFITNGTQYPDIFDQASKFHRLQITVSIDDMEERFESQRYGASWQQVSENLKRFVACKNATPNMKVGISITVNIQNVLYLPKLVSWLRANGIDHYYFNMLKKPEWISIDSLTHAAKDLVLQRLRNTNLAPKDQIKLDYVIRCVENSATSDGKDFCQKMLAKDQIRKENFATTHSEIANAMGFVLQS